MSQTLLQVSNLSAGTEDKPILHNISLEVGAGETHVLMGPNGAGKSTLGHVIMGDPQYIVSEGKIVFDGQDVTELAADKRSLAGIFLSYQAPVEVPGVPLYTCGGQCHASGRCGCRRSADLCVQAILHRVPRAGRTMR